MAGLIRLDKSYQYADMILLFWTLMCILHLSLTVRTRNKQNEVIVELHLRGGRMDERTDAGNTIWCL